jgi:hypothetical protein
MIEAGFVVSGDKGMFIADLAEGASNLVAYLVQKVNHWSADGCVASDAVACMRALEGAALWRGRGLSSDGVQTRGQMGQPVRDVFDTV